MTAFDPIIDQIGEWNPQLFRELKGKFKPRNLLICVAIAVIIQILFIALFSLQLPDTNQITDSVKTISSEFCIGQKEYESARFLSCSLPLKINWQPWWLYQFRVISWGLPVLVAGIGSALLAIDVSQEASRGTLNFIRLSPQSATTILWGKLLGVPALVYLGAILFLPLHLISAVGGGIELGFLLSYYLMIGLGYFLLNSLALLIGLISSSISGTNQLNSPINVGMTVGLFSMAAVWAYMFLNLASTWAKFNKYLLGEASYIDLQWFQISISKNPWTANGFAIVSVLLVVKGIWMVLERKYNYPTRSILSKRQAYIYLAFLQIFVLGFLVRDQPSSFQGMSKWGFKAYCLILLNVVNYLAFLTLILSLTPQRQMLMDWLRYRHLNTNQSKRSLWQDLIWHENSPSVMAIALCGLNSAVILLPWSLWGNELEISLKILAVFISQVLAMLIFATIYQALIFWAKNKRQQVLAIAIFLGLIIVPPIFLVVAPLPKFVWILAGYPAVSMIDNFAISFSFIAAISAQVGVLSFFNLRLTHSFRQAAKSESQQLLQNSQTETLSNA